MSSASRSSPPRWLARESSELACGYAPRSIQISADSKTLFVGCKDGNVSVVEDFTEDRGPDHEARPLRLGVDNDDNKAALGVRALCAWGDLLFIGRDDGKVDLVRWTASEERPGESCEVHFTIVGGSSESPSAFSKPITFLDWIDGERLVLSFLDHATYVIQADLESPPEDLTEPVRLDATSVDLVTGLACAVRIGPGKWMFVSQSGKVWKAQDQKGRIKPESPKDSPWPPGDEPGFVTDYALIKPETGSGTDDVDRPYPLRVGNGGVYVSTDNGVYLLRWWDEDEDFKPLRVSLQGVSGLCMAISYYATDEHQFLWVSDYAGTAHLFWDVLDRESLSNPNWRRSGIRHDESQVILAVASWYSEENNAFVVGQARRNDRIVITHYRRQPGSDAEPERTARKEPTQKGSDKTLYDLLRSEYPSVAEDIGAFVEPRSADEGPWNTVTIVADLFEKAGQEPGTLKVLLEFLGNPTETLAYSVLEPLEPKCCEEALELWTHALLGVVHRRVQQDRERHYLGIIRWLRVVAGKFETDELREVFGTNIRFARKWGLFGSTYSQRVSAMKPLAALHQQDNQQDKGAPSGTSLKLLDQLVYRGRIFFDRIDLEFESIERREYGRTAWDVRTLEMKRGKKHVATAVAVSWVHGGIDLYQLDRCPGPGGSGCKLTRKITFELDTSSQTNDRCVLIGRQVGSEENPSAAQRSSRIDPAKYGHCRSIVLGSLEKRQKGSGRGYYLLGAPATAQSQPEYFQVWALGVDADGNIVLDDGGKGASVSKPAVMCELKLRGTPSSSQASDKESVYSMLEVKPGVVAAGLKGLGNKPQIVLIKIGVGKDGPKLDFFEGEEGELQGYSPESKAFALNRIWSLACDPEQRKTGTFFAGCGDGQVLKLHLGKIEEDFTLKPQLVERLGAPVWAVACRHIENVGYRVFAGGADGTITAWQESKSSREHQSPRVASCKPIWSTWEAEGAIARMHCFRYGVKYRDGSQEEIDAVLAVTQRGVAVLFEDRAFVETKTVEEEKNHRRLALPGARHGRMQLKASAYASVVAEVPEPVDQKAAGKRLPPVVTRLVSASGDGRVHLYTLHLPKQRRERQEEHDELMSMWLSSIEAETVGVEQSPGHDTSARTARSRLRRAESVQTAARAVPLAPVRWLLDDEQRWRDGTAEIHASWLPLHLRPLLGLRVDWRDDLTDRELGDLVKQLEDALSHAHNLRDLDLFAEIMTVLLRRTNQQLFELACQPSEAGSSAAEPATIWKHRIEYYRQMLAAFETGIRRWLGTPDNELRLWILFAKNLVDGDTLLQLSLHSVASQDRRQQAFSEILQTRIRYLRQMLVSGKPLLALETLRAVNLSMLRACVRLDARRPEGWRPDPEGRPLGELPWEALKNYLKALSDYASRVAHSRTGVNDSLKHEIARSYALGLCACPSAAVRIAHWMAEANLIVPAEADQDFAKFILDQCEVLAELGVAVPEREKRLFKRAMSDQAPQGSFPHRYFRDTELCKKPKALFKRLKEDCVGVESARVLAGFTIFYEIVDELLSLEAKLRGDAAYIDLKKLHAFRGRIEARRGKFQEDHEIFTEASVGDKPQALFRHSFDFWENRLGAFQREVLERYSKELDRDPPPKGIRPAIVLLHQDLEEWCRDSVELLEKMLKDHDIFEPQYSLYRKTLERLRSAAKSFPESAAVQKNIVVGVLGHRLLESLDEHVLELEEIAQALDPLMVWDYQEGQRRLEDLDTNSSAERFALYLLRRSRNAESIPKNLRTLQRILQDPAGKGNGGLIDFQGDLLSGFSPKSGSVPSQDDAGWHFPDRDEPDDFKIADYESRYLKLVLDELDQNDRLHGLPFEHREVATDWPTVVVESADHSRNPPVLQRRVVTLRFRFELPVPEPRASERNSEFRKRLESLRKNGLQRPLDPREDRSVASNGTGLYLANFAAAGINWKLSLDKIEFPKRKNPSCLGSLVFKLERVRDIERQNL